jgi:hypothetical protein
MLRGGRIVSLYMFQAFTFRHTYSVHEADVVNEAAILFRVTHKVRTRLGLGESLISSDTD